MLAQFAQASGGPAPQLVQGEDGVTKIEWHGGATVDFYSRSASGGSTLTPYSGGHYHRIGMQSDLRGTAPEGDVSWMQFALTQSDDLSLLLLGNSQINTLSGGRAGQGYRVAFGDVAVNHSSLGANFGQTLVSASAGVIAESWEAMADQGRWRMFLKNAYAFKAESPLAPSGGRRRAGRWRWHSAGRQRECASPAGQAGFSHAGASAANGTSRPRPVGHAATTRLHCPPRQKRGIQLRHAGGRGRMREAARFARHRHPHLSRRRCEATPMTLSALPNS